MKIIQIITLGHQIYGAQKHVLDLSVQLHKHGHEVLVLMGTTGELSRRLEKKGVPFKQVKNLKREIRPISDLRCINELYRIIKDFRPDLVATHSSKAGMLGRTAAWMAGTPNTFTSHGWSFEEGIPEMRRRVFLFLERIVARVSNKIITVAAMGKELGLQHAVAPEEKIVTVYNGVEDTVGDYINRPPKDELIFTMVAGFRDQKDHTTLIKALAQLKQYPWKVYFLGEGELMEKTKELARECGLQDRLHFQGAVNNVLEYLEKSDILTLISNWEGLPISIIEGMCFSLPIIATDVAGVKEEVVDGYNGITVARGDVTAVKEAFEYLITNRDKRIEYGRNSRDMFEKQFTLRAMYKQTVEVYNSILSTVKVPESLS